MRFTSTVLVSLSLPWIAVAACGGSDAATTTTTSSASSGTGGGGGAGGGGCPVGSHENNGACEATLESWSMASSLKHARDHHVTFAASTPAGAFLYVAGGTDGVSVFSDIERAPINADGTLGAFAGGGKLPKAILGHGLAQVDRTIVIAGGADGYNSLAESYVGVIGDDGNITFTKGPSLATSRYHVSLSIHGGYLYAVGGLEQMDNGGMVTQKVLDSVERAPFDGKTLGAFETIDPLPAPLTHQAAVVYQDSLYLIGGISTSKTLTSIQRAAFDPNGKLTAWDTVSMLPEGRATSAAFVLFDQLYVLCGSKGVQSGEVATVLRAPMGGHGQPGAFEELPPVPLPRAHVHQVPLYNGNLYSAGGMNMNQMQNEVFIGKMD